MINFNCRCI